MIGIRRAVPHCRRSCLAPLVVLLAGSPGLTRAEPIDELRHLSLEQLSNLVVTSVSKSAEPLRAAPAALYVITRSDIERSGAVSIAEILRLAPNLRVTQLTASNYVVSARGFGGNTSVQNFSNKILMLIDGRSVYTPLYSGIYLDAQDVNLADVDRIEVISGAGATLWGANAVNGVINIITRSASQTRGGEFAAGTGTEDKQVSARYGDALGHDGAIRFYAKAISRNALELADGTNAQDGWNKVQGGFRGDWARAAEQVTVQGDLYRGTESQRGTAGQQIGGGDLLARWQHSFAASDVTAQAYLDETQRAAPAGGVAFVLHTYDIQIQQNATLGSRNRLIWGAGDRFNDYAINNSAGLLFAPSRRNQSLANVFLQDSLSLAPGFDATLGLKAENDPYSGWSLLPDARLSWAISGSEALWASASRAIRSPTPFDEDVVEKIGSVTFLTGNRSFQPEQVRAYEIGYRGQPAARLSLSATMFYNAYSDLRTVEPAPGGGFLPLYWGNRMAGETFGLESWVDWQVLDRWRLSSGVQWLRENLSFTQGASGLLGVSQAGDDPTHQMLLKSSLDISRAMTFDASLRYVGRLPNPGLASYVEMNLRWGWQLNRNLQISVSGNNLLHTYHLEYPAPDGERISRAVYAEARWKF